MKYVLHSYRRCPFCIRTRILLYLKNIPYEIVEEPLREWTPWMIEWSFQNNERSRVPVLRYVLEEGEERILGASQDLEQSLRKVYSVCKTEKIMPESNEMNLFIDTIDEKPGFTPLRDSIGYREMIEWWDWCKDELKPMIDLYKYGANLKFNAEAHVFHTLELQKLVQVLEDVFVRSEGLSHSDAVRGASEACDQAVVKSTARGASERGNKEMRRMRSAILLKNDLRSPTSPSFPSFVRSCGHAKENLILHHIPKFSHGQTASSKLIGLKTR